MCMIAVVWIMELKVLKELIPAISNFCKCRSMLNTTTETSSHPTAAVMVTGLRSPTICSFLCKIPQKGYTAHCDWSSEDTKEEEGTWCRVQDLCEQGGGPGLGFLVPSLMNHNYVYCGCKALSEIIFGGSYERWRDWMPHLWGHLLTQCTYFSCLAHSLPHS